MQTTKASCFSKQEIARSFDNAADTYDAAAFFQREVADRILERLHYIRLNPATILDLGAGTGYASSWLSSHYKKAKVVLFDLSEKMLFRSKKQQRWFDRKRYVTGDAEKLPFKDNSFDLVFSNLMLHWSNDLKHTLAEVRRVLKPDGLFLFSTLGPDTLFELRQSWAAIDANEHVHHFIDMHVIGDYLQNLNFKEAVMDMEFITVTYNDIKKILIDLKNLGTHNIGSSRHKGLTGKQKFNQFIRSYEQLRNAEGLLPVTYEVVYGLGWKAKTEKNMNEFSIPITDIKRSN